MSWIREHTVDAINRGVDPNDSTVEISYPYADKPKLSYIFEGSRRLLPKDRDLPTIFPKIIRSSERSSRILRTVARRAGTGVSKFGVQSPRTVAKRRSPPARFVQQRSSRKSLRDARWRRELSPLIDLLDKISAPKFRSLRRSGTAVPFAIRISRRCFTIYRTG